jgi:hypothetical protein
MKGAVIEKGFAWICIPANHANFGYDNDAMWTIGLKRGNWWYVAGEEQGFKHQEVLVGPKIGWAD